MVINGIVRNYDFWIFHGEEKIPTIDIIDDDSSEDTNDDGTDDMAGLIADVIGEPNFVAFGSDERVAQEINEEPNDNAKRFYRLIRDAETKLYPGCENFSKLSFIVKLLHIKSLGGWSNKSFTMLLELLKEAFPLGETLPKSYYEAKKIIRDLGLSYEKIDACVNDCVLFRKEYANAEQCSICGVARWKSKGRDNVVGESSSARMGKNIAQKTLRYFPLTPRLQRLYMSSKTAFDMR